jgi:hypothetical protein
MLPWGHAGPAISEAIRCFEGCLPKGTDFTITVLISKDSEIGQHPFNHSCQTESVDNSAVRATNSPDPIETTGVQDGEARKGESSKRHNE